MAGERIIYPEEERRRKWISKIYYMALDLKSSIDEIRGDDDPASDAHMKTILDLVDRIIRTRNDLGPAQHSSKNRRRTRKGL